MDKRVHAEAIAQSVLNGFSTAKNARLVAEQLGLEWRNVVECYMRLKRIENERIK